MTKGIYTVALSFAVLTAGVWSGARAEAAHNSQTGAHTSNPYDGAHTTFDAWRRLDAKIARLRASNAARERSLQRSQSTGTPDVLPDDALWRTQNEN